MCTSRSISPTVRQLPATGVQCFVDLTQTVPLLCLLTLGQVALFPYKAAGGYLTKREQESDQPSVTLYAVVWLPTNGVLLLVFLIEAFALPFGTKSGHIAFSLFDTHDLHWSVVVCLGGLVVSALLRPCFSASGSVHVFSPSPLFRYSGLFQSTSSSAQCGLSSRPGGSSTRRSSLWRGTRSFWCIAWCVPSSPRPVRRARWRAHPPPRGRPWTGSTPSRCRRRTRAE
jgi:hypothetical protein